MPENCGVELYYLADSQLIEYAAVRPYTVSVTIDEPRVVQRSMVESELARDSTCRSCRVDKKDLSEDNLRKLGLIKEGEKLERVIFREAEKFTYEGNVLDQNAPFDIVYVKKNINVKMAKITTFPLDQDQ
jgi:hypothetical protein